MIRSCFGGGSNRGRFIVSGSEDAKIYVWHKDSLATGAGGPLECLSGHEKGSVNDVAWNLVSKTGMFASAGGKTSAFA